MYSSGTRMLTAWRKSLGDWWDCSFQNWAQASSAMIFENAKKNFSGMMFDV